MKICWIVLCYNEIDILPYVSKYWERLGVDKVVVFDNGSTDGSIDYLTGLTYVELRHFSSNGQNDIIQKQLKETAYIEFKNSYDIIVISDMDEVFWFKDFKVISEEFINGGYDVMAAPIFSLCEDFKPQPEEGKLLHEQCHKFYHQRMNHMNGFDDYSKLSIFNCRTVNQVNMSVGQHFVETQPSMKVMLAYNGFCMHIDKGFGVEYKFRIRQKMNNNLSDVNRRFGMCIEYADSYEKLKQEYEDNQKKSFDINDFNNND